MGAPSTYLLCVNVSIENPIVGTILVVLAYTGGKLEAKTNNLAEYILWFKSVEDGCLSTVVQTNTDDFRLLLFQTKPLHQVVEQTHSVFVMSSGESMLALATHNSLQVA